jgi:hypothetical protein
MNKKNIKTRALPTIDYEPLIHAIAHEISDRKAMETDTAERARLRLTGHVDSQWERFEAWGALGDHYAETLENPDTPAAVHNALAEELMDLAHKANLGIDSAEVVRLLYPLLRHRAWQREKGGEGDAPETPAAEESRDHEEQPGEDGIVAAHLARMLESENTPEDVRRQLGEFLSEVFSEAGLTAEEAEMLKTTYPLAMKRLREREQGTSVR